MVAADILLDSTHDFERAVFCALVDGLAGGEHDCLILRILIEERFVDAALLIQLSLVSIADDLLEGHGSTVGSVDYTDQEVKHHYEHPEGLAEPQYPNHGNPKVFEQIVCSFPFTSSRIGFYFWIGDVLFNIGTVWILQLEKMPIDGHCQFTVCSSESLESCLHNV